MMVYNMRTAVKFIFFVCNIILFFGCSTEIEIKDINNSDIKVIGYVAEIGRASCRERV